jgi:hypothetical protein
LEKIEAVNFSEDDEAEDMDDNNSFAYCQFTDGGNKQKSGVKK